MHKPEHETSPHKPEGHPEAHGSSVGFYIFVAVVLAIITYIEFALVEHQETWFAWMSRPWLFFWLVVLSAIKFLMVVMFFMHLKQDHRAFTGFFSSGMVIAVGTLAALAALFSVRSIAEAQAPAEPEGAPTEAHGAPHSDPQGDPHGDPHAIGADFGLEDNRDPLERFAHPAPKTQDVTRTELRPTLPGSADGSGAGLGADVLAMTGGALPSASTEDPLVNPTGLIVGESPFPLAEAAPEITLPNFFAADGTPQPLAGTPAEGEATEEAAAPPAETDAAQAEAEQTGTEQPEAAQTDTAPTDATQPDTADTAAAPAETAPPRRARLCCARSTSAPARASTPPTAPRATRPTVRGSRGPSRRSPATSPTSRSPRAAATTSCSSSSTASKGKSGSRAKPITA